MNATNGAESRPKRRSTSLRMSGQRRKGRASPALRPTTPAASRLAASQGREPGAARSRNKKRSPAPAAAARIVLAASLPSAYPAETTMSSSPGRRSAEQKGSLEQSTGPGQRSCGRTTCRPGRTVQTFPCSRCRDSERSSRRMPRSRTWEKRCHPRLQAEESQAHGAD